MPSPDLSRELETRAKRARGKEPRHGMDVDPNSYRSQAPPHTDVNLGEFTPQRREAFLRAGIDPSGEQRAGTYVQIDHSVVHRSVNVADVDVMTIEQALATYPWVRERYWWQAMAVDGDRYTAEVALNPHHGYFLRAKPGVTCTFPLQACLFMGQDGLVQNVHNIIVAEEGSELNVITGCAVDMNVRRGLHIGVSEIYVQRGAKLSFTMIHNWAEDVVVRPRTTVIVDEGGVFLSNYVSLQPVRDVQMYPTARLVGKGAIARFNTIILAPPGSHLDIGARVLLEGSQSRAEVISRAVSTGGTIIARGHLRGDAPGIVAHLECDGLMLNDEGCIRAVPELEGHIADMEMSHEAAVGKIARAEIEYLRARGLTEAEATAAIVRGFLNVDILGLPKELAAEIDRVISSMGASLF